MARITLGFITLIFTLSSWGCARSTSGKVYSRNHTQRLYPVEIAVVESIRAVTIEGTRSNVGTAAGAIVGGAGGYSIGDSQTSRRAGRTVGGAVGVVVGGIAGAAAEEALTRHKGYEITVKMSDGELLAIVQKADVKFERGEEVRIITADDGTVRVSRY